MQGSEHQTLAGRHGKIIGKFRTQHFLQRFAKRYSLALAGDASGCHQPYRQADCACKSAWLAYHDIIRLLYSLSGAFLAPRKKMESLSNQSGSSRKNTASI